MFMTKVFEVLATKGIDTKVYADRDALEQRIFALEDEIFGTDILQGQQRKVSQMFRKLKEIPFSDPTRDDFKKRTLAEKDYLEKLQKELEQQKSDFNKTLEV